MHYFSKVLKTDDDLMSRTTLLIRQIPNVKDTGVKESLQEYFQQKFPQVTITGIQLIHNYAKLEELEQEYVNIMNALQYSETLNENRPVRVTIRPYACGRLICCICCVQKVDAVEYFTDERNRVNDKINREVHQMAELPARAAFISFERDKTTNEYAKDPIHF